MECVFITGASSGIGRATALHFSKIHAELILVSRRMDKLNEVREECLVAGAQAVQVFSLDVTDSVAVQSYFRTHQEILSKVTVLVNNAGLALGMSSFQESLPEDTLTMIRTNFEAAVSIVQGMLPHFLSKSSGHIVQLGSVAGRWTYPKGSIYCATKAALKVFSEGLRMDLSGTGIRVSEIAPGLVETDFSRVRFKGDEEKANVPYRGLDPLTADDIAETILWVCLRPRHIKVQELIIYPTAQASPTVVHRQ